MPPMTGTAWDMAGRLLGGDPTSQASLAGPDTLPRLRSPAQALTDTPASCIQRDEGQGAYHTVRVIYGSA